MRGMLRWGPVVVTVGIVCGPLVGAPSPVGAAGGTNPFRAGRAPVLNGSYDALSALDVNADGACDLVAYREGSGADGLWFGRRDRTFSFGPAPSLGGVADVVVSEDFNGDGFGDLLLAAKGRAPERFAYGKRSGHFRGAAGPAIDGGWDALVAGDFDGNGFGDLFLYRAGSGTEQLWRGGRSGLRPWAAPRVSGTYQRVAVGDFNGDRRDDIFFYGAGSAPDRVLRGARSGGFTLVSAAARGWYGAIPTGDFDGNGRDDALFYSPGRRGERLLWGGVTAAFEPGPALTVNGYYSPAACDFDADGADDIVWYGRGPLLDRLWWGTPAPFAMGHVLPANAGWLQAFNHFRSMSGLAPVTENPAFSHGDYLHSRYLAQTWSGGHDEDTTSPWYTPEGAEAGRSSNVVAGGGPAQWPGLGSQAEIIAGWMAAPFHAAWMVNPRLRQTGYGAYTNISGGRRFDAASLDVIRGVDWDAPWDQPVVWPGDGSTVHLISHCCEAPSPLEACPGYSEPSGLPIVVLMPYGEPASGASAVLRRGATPVETCLVTAANHWAAEGDQVFLVPRRPLVPGSTYSVTVYTARRGLTFSFHVGYPLGY